MKPKHVAQTVAFSLGFAFMRAWALTFLASSGVTQPLSPQMFDGVLTVFIPVLVLSMAAIMLASGPLRLNLVSTRALVAGGLLLAAGTALLEFAGDGAFPLAEALSALGFSVVLMQWGWISSCIPPDRLMTSLSLGFAAAGLLCFALCLLPELPTSIAFVGFALLSTASLAFLSREEDVRQEALSAERRRESPPAGEGERRHRGTNALLRLFAAMFVMELVARSSLMLSGEYFTSTAHSRPFSFELARLLGTTLAAAAFGIVGKRAKEPLRTLYMFVPVLLVCSCLFLLFESLGMPFITYAVAFAAGAWLETAFWILFSHSHRRLGYSPCFIWGVGRIAFWISTLVGLALWSYQASYFGGSIVSSSEAVMTLVVVMALGTLVVYIFVLPEDILKTMGFIGKEATASQPSGTVEQATEALAEEHGLSKREREVLLLLAKGRSTAYIQDQLFISSGTVCSHRDRIYRKLGIHSKQELLDLIEEQMDGRRDSASFECRR